MTFTAQQLSHRIELQRVVYGERDPSTGHRAESWETYGVAYARVDPLVGREFFAAAAVQAESTIKFTMRWRDDVKAINRLLHEGNRYDITSAINVGGRNRELLILAKALNT